jgi:hypothetical protein
MGVKKNIKKSIFKLGKKARRIFRITYENLSAQIFYDPNNSYKLQLCIDDQCRPGEVLLVREISREQAFRIMNTRY